MSVSKLRCFPVFQHPRTPTTALTHQGDLPLLPFVTFALSHHHFLAAFVQIISIFLHLLLISSTSNVQFNWYSSSQESFYFILFHFVCVFSHVVWGLGFGRISPARVRVSIPTAGNQM
jgi:hypothetical protein